MYKDIEKGNTVILAYRIDHLLFADWLPQVNGPLSALISTVANHEKSCQHRDVTDRWDSLSNHRDPFSMPLYKNFLSLSERERPRNQQQLLWELWETNCCAFENGNRCGIQEALVTDQVSGFSIVSTGSYVICSVIIPQTKHANSLAAAVFATFLGEWDAIR